MWQDWVFSIGSWIFVVALIPTIRGKNKPPLSTNITMGIVLAIFALTYSSLNLWVSATSTAATSISWFILVYQTLRKK